MKTKKSRTILKTLALFVTVGVLMMVGGCGEVDNVAVNSVTITTANNVTEITTLGGTLQMSAIVGPNKATDKAVVWSIINTTGQATISDSGLLTAISDGDVIVWSTAESLTNFYDAMIITLSNQVADDTLLLTNALTSANTNFQSVVTSINGSDVFPGTTWVRNDRSVTYQIAITSAQSVMNNEKATQAQIDSAIATLKTASFYFNAGKHNGTKILVNGITIASKQNVSTISTINGTLQMYSGVLPANATDKTMIWSVTNGTGSATISVIGLLTALTDGTVTVTITSATMPNIFTTMEIVISNQLAEENFRLINEIVIANDNRTEVLISSTGTEYLENTEWVTQEVMTAYKNVIAAAQLVAYDVMALQNEVDMAIYNLYNATTTFNSAKNFGTYSTSEEITRSTPILIPIEKIDVLNNNR